MLPVKQRQQLKSRAHHLKPVIMIGQAGLSESLLKEAEIAIEHHELLKIKLPTVDRDQREAIIDRLCEALHAERIQSVGRTVTLYRKKRTED
ncbi:MAG: ribosome assembly RNA-binding protein YhbY [Gammaproteobacteria bacterium]|nr:MAG: ribosome assembly RNA-binding protein YhbY [Gammaproteobacteria bacterium]